MQGNFVPSHRDKVPIGSVEKKEDLLASDSRKYCTTPHYDGYPAVFVRFAETDVEELGEVLTDSWRLAAPKRVLAEFDAAEGRKRNKPT